VRTFQVDEPGEAIATVRARCDRCDWGEEGREAAALRLSLDGRYSQHLLLARAASSSSDYRVTLGRVAPGRHRLTIERDPELSANGAGAVSMTDVGIAVLARSDPEFIAQSMAPILFARPNTVGRFTDLPLFMWYEIVPTAHGRQFRYSVIFSNEDGGTPADRLMATWGRTTDIEFVYGVEIDASGRIVAEEFQGPGHEVPPFRGQHEAAHPLLYVSTDNNMVSESGSTRVRYAPAPSRYDLADVSREVVMDDQSWLYPIMAQELRRESKIVDDAPPGNGTIPDPRRFAYLEACGTVGTGALAFAIGVTSGVRLQPDLPGRGVPLNREVSGSVRLQPDLPGRGVPRNQEVSGRVRLQPDLPGRGVPLHREVSGSVRLQPDLRWIPSDRGLDKYRIVRDGCFRVAIPLPSGTKPRDIRALRVLAYVAPVQLTRINTLFLLNDRVEPGPSMLRWQGSETIRPESPFEVPIP
jgi:hypothetical protein